MDTKTISPLFIELQRLAEVRLSRHRIPSRPTGCFLVETSRWNVPGAIGSKRPDSVIEARMLQRLLLANRVFKIDTESWL